MRQNVLVPKCSMQADFRKLLEDPLFSDCSLWAAGEEIKAHKAILSARCPVFKAMFSQDMKERRTNHFDIHDMDPEVLKEIVYFIYTGDAPNLPEMASKVIAAADMYLLESLKVKCEEALCSSLSVENAAELLILGDLRIVIRRSA
ncbi:speckle-type POZ protein-like A [Denticeps clupeoides]|uniref:speckle-type POZ protein-like A n=1 Tax=Denticeps clupeoides TaxID=299321 RepID=UPI0010A2C1EA|nr:speckle-type POZ protein-like A [Denticeps clupeoides]